MALACRSKPIGPFADGFPTCILALNAQHRDPAALPALVARTQLGGFPSENVSSVTQLSKFHTNQRSPKRHHIQVAHIISSDETT